jgi:L-lactate dehydrogenase complex protein LldG
MTARDQILSKIKHNLDRATDLDGNNPAIERIEAHQANLIPSRGRLVGDQLIDLFCEEAKRVNATITRVDHFDNVPTAVGAYLREHQLPAKIKLAPHPRLKSLDWQQTTSLMVADGRADGDDPVSVSLALGGVAETGTLVMASGPDTPTSLNFLPLDHIVVLDAADLAGDYEAVWAKIRAKAKEAGKSGQMPRTVNWITGPSRTADIEQTLLLGAHGPQRLHIILVDKEGDG